MAIKLSNNKGKRALISEINVTPLVDVMLVLLIIFMITSPMLVAGINVDLPETKAQAIASQDEPLVVSVDKKGMIYIMETQIELAALKDKLFHVTKEKKDSRIFVRGDKGAIYGDVVKVIGDIQEAGFTKVALISSIKNDSK